MFYFLSLLIGLILVFSGLLMSMQALSSLRQTIQSFDTLRADTKYIDLASLRKELDELNFSYYEILDDTSKRLDAIDSILRQNQMNREVGDDNLEFKSMKNSEFEEHRKTLAFVNDVGAIERNAIDSTKREVIFKMVSEGMTDHEIAKVLGIGVGEVSILRRTNQTSQSNGQ